MRYLSTRGDAPTLDFASALLAGLARDGGLYLPATWPVFDAATIAGFAGRPFAEVAAAVLGAFAGGSIPQTVIETATHSAYAGFGHAAVTPLAQIGPNEFVLELFHGPTLAFKDVAMQVLARLMDHVLETRDQRCTIVGATSGDTGGAAIEAFAGAARADVFILFPEGRVSDVQRRMMTTSDANNVHALSVDGTFDDCQSLVKALFNHHAFRDQVALAGVNSINWARIAAQVSYYFAAAVALGAPHRAVDFVVPTGNFGDIFAGYVAKKMGLPIGRLVIATNINDILARTLETGLYEVRGVAATTSPSMDIQISSNFERLLFEATGRDAAAVRAMMASLAQSGRFTLPEAALSAIRAEFSAFRADEALVAHTIRATRDGAGYLIDPHTATAVAAMQAQAAPHAKGRAPGVPAIALGTAHPAKFPDAMAAITGARPALPARLAGLMQAPERIETIANDRATLEAHVLERMRPLESMRAGRHG